MQQQEQHKKDSQQNNIKRSDGLPEKQIEMINTAAGFKSTSRLLHIMGSNTMIFCCFKGVAYMSPLRLCYKLISFFWNIYDNKYNVTFVLLYACLLYTSDAADE